MNVDRILAVADAIEHHTIPWLGFNMFNFMAGADTIQWSELKDHTGHDCGTVACIAGWTNAIRKNLKQSSTITDFNDEYGAADWLGISSHENAEGDSQANQLFYARNHPLYIEHGSLMWKDITADQAVRTLRHLAVTGEVDWTV